MEDAYEEAIKEIMAHILTIEDVIAAIHTITDEELGEITERKRKLVNENWN